MSTLRKALEEAINSAESSAPAPASAPASAPAPAPAPAPSSNDAPATSSNDVPTPSSNDAPAPAPAPVSTPAPDDASADKTEGVEFKGRNIDLSRPPVSWKPAAKAKWDQVPTEARMEAHRRDLEVTAALNASANARKLEQQFMEAVRPFEAHIRARGAHPIQAFSELLKADYILTTAPGPKKAEYMAMLIKDYGIDLQALDAALAGQPVADPVESKVDKLLQERLRPIQSFLHTQARTIEQQQAAQVQKAREQLEAMANNPEKYPYFEEVREDMADIIELQAKRGVYLTLDQAYTRAVALNPEVSSQVSAAQEADRQRKAAAAAHARAAKAKAASVSVSGAPNGTPTAQGNQDLRSTIEAAFNQATGR